MRVLSWSEYSSGLLGVGCRYATEFIAYLILFAIFELNGSIKYEHLLYEAIGLF